MTRTLKLLGLSLAALCAFGALLSSSALAAGETFHSEVETTILTGNNHNTNQLFAVSGITTTCKKATFKGTMLHNTESSITLFPTYTECEDSLGNKNIVFDTTGCAFVIGSETTGSGHLPLSVECTAGIKGMVKTDPSCTLTITPQTATNGIQVTNVGAGATREMTFHITASLAVDKGTQAGCFFLGNVLTYTGTGVLAGFVDNGVHGDIDEVTGHTTVYTEGAQVGIWWQ